MILVTGSSGFIGSSLCDKIDSDNIIACDVLGEEAMSPTSALQFLEDSNQIECVFHLGAISSTTETDIHKLTSTNILFSAKLLELCVKMSIPFIYASSASVYGMGQAGFREDVILSPMNYYAISKASFDMFALQKIKDNPDSKIFGLRYFNVYGSGEKSKENMASPIYKFIKQAQNLNEIRIFEGSESFVRDFVHIDDVISITLHSQNFNKSGIYNVGTGRERSFLDVAAIISDMTGAHIKKIPFPLSLADKYQKFTKSDNRKIDLTGYSSSRVSLEEGIREVFSGL